MQELPRCVLQWAAGCYSAVVGGIMRHNSLFIILAFIGLAYCSNKIDSQTQVSSPQTDTTSVESEVKYRSLRESHRHWFKEEEADSILIKRNLNDILRRCLFDRTLIINTKDVLSDFDKFNTINNLGDINNDGIDDYVIAIPVLQYLKNNSIEDGIRFEFSDTTIPAININVPCGHADFLFPLGDIDNDGFVELGKYYTSCVSRFKGLETITIKDGKWQKLAQVIFDVAYEEPKKEERIEDLTQGKFRMREITNYYNIDSVQDNWKYFQIDTITPQLYLGSTEVN